jgi:Tol biopolymer transport system component
VTGYLERPIGINDSGTLERVSPSELSITLSDLTANCATTGPTTQTVTMVNGESTWVRFEVSCSVAGEGVILFTNYGLPHVYRVGPDGSNLADLTPSGAACCGDWSPDGPASPLPPG